MNKLQKAAGLLNDEAPKGEFLAYINAKEAGLLSSRGGAGIDINNSGVPSYIEYDDSSGSGHASASSSSSSSSDDSGGSGSDYDYNYAMSVQNQINNKPSSNNEDIDSQYTTGKEFNVDPTPLTYWDYAKDDFLTKTIFGSTKLHKANIIDKIISDPFTGVGGLLLSTANSKYQAEKQPEPNLATGEDGIGEGDYKSTVQDWAESRGLTTDYSSEDLERQLEIDQLAFDAGFRTEDAKNMNLTGGGNNNNPPPIQEIDSNSAAIPDSIRTVQTAGTGLPDPSGWINNYIGSKANIMDLYNNVRNTLYSARSTQGLLAVSDSPYYDFLKLNKIDRRIL